MNTQSRKSILSGFMSISIISIGLMFSVLISSVRGSENHYKTETTTTTEIISSKIQFDEVYIIITIVKIKGGYYKGVGNSQSISLGKGKSYLNCLFNYTHNKPLTRWERFKFVTIPRLFKGGLK